MKNMLSPARTVSAYLSLLAVLTLLFVHTAFADATVKYEQMAGNHKSINTMQIKNDKIRITPANRANKFSLYDSKTSTLTHVDIDRKQYLSMDETDIAEQAGKAKQRIDILRQQMQAKMKDMPPEQKARMEQMMNSRLPKFDAERNPDHYEQKKTDKTETIAGVKCTVYDSFVNGTKVSEICMATPEQLGLVPEDAQTLMSMQDFMMRMQKIAQKMMGNNAPSAELQGIPLHTTLLGPDGSIRLNTRLLSISTTGLSNDTMTIPKGFTAAQPPTMPAMQ